MSPARSSNPSPSDFSPFRPAEAEANDIFTAIATARDSLFDLAAAHNTTPEAFALWLEAPDTQARLASLSASLAAFARMGALTRLPSATNALHGILQHFNALPDAAHPAAAQSASATPDPGPLPKPQASKSDMRERRLALAAACLMVRITRTPDRPRPARVPAPEQPTTPPFPPPRAPAETSSQHSPHIAAPRSPVAGIVNAFDPLSRGDPADQNHRARGASRGDAPAQLPPPHLNTAAAAARAGAINGSIGLNSSVGQSNQPAKLEPAADAANSAPAANRAPASRAWRAKIAEGLVPILQPDEHALILSRMEHMTDQEICEMIEYAREETLGPRPASSLLSAAGTAGPGP